MDGSVFIHRLVYTQDLNARLFRLHQGRQFFLEKSSDNLDTSSETVQNMSGRKRKVGKVVGFFLWGKISIFLAIINLIIFHAWENYSCKCSSCEEVLIISFISMPKVGREKSGRGSILSWWGSGNAGVVNWYFATVWVDRRIFFCCETCCTGSARTESRSCRPMLTKLSFTKSARKCPPSSDCRRLWMMIQKSRPQRLATWLG